ncbi:MAG TPA: 3-hydroxyacyl-CoA dehydrogenase NAD-binding domain-containing protein, partial [Gammaproteobacteria bacterium]|nr:3-hydroxyacyl-CoA dehydrogenase NAD-binding domain-containing protein [Gammaproteobacteria bacterium]
ELSLACDYRVAANDGSTSLGLPEVQLGIHPGFGGTVRSIRVMGVLPAMNMMLTGKPLRAKAALKTGLVDKLAKPAELKNAAVRIALNAPSPTRAPILQKLASLPGVRSIVAGQLRKQVAGKAKKEHYPAPYAIIDLWEKHWGADAEMYLAEAKSIAHLMNGETARNLVRVFLLQDKLKGLGNKKDLNLKHVHVVGAGVMGGDIAAWCALRGFNVTLQDREMKYIEPAIKRAHKLFEKKLKKEPAIQDAKDRFTPDVDAKGVAKADIVIEAIFENTEAKQKLYAELEPKMKKGAVLATNTSSIKLEDLGKTLSDPNRLVGVHFFNPVAKMPLVEVVKSDSTDAKVVDKALAFTRHIGKLGVPVKSAPGFLVNRILMPYMMEAVRIAEDGVAFEAIDKAATNFGMPMGPVELADTVGLDVGLSVGQILAQELGGEVPTKLQEKVDAKKLGRKSGEGFYVWEDGKAQKDKDLARNIPDDAQDRLILPMLNTAVACLREGVVDNKDLLDAGVIFGTGFAPFRGGPAKYIETRGPAKVKARLEELAAKYGERFTPDAGWDKF